MMYRGFFPLLIAIIFLSCSSTAQKPPTERGPVSEHSASRSCGENEVKTPCGRRCEDRCTGLRPQICDTMKCDDDGCRCRDGYSRNPYTSRCILTEDCPIDGCAEGEYAGLCGRRCEGTCEYPAEPQSCITPRCRHRGCRCDLSGGFVRSNTTNTCVRIGKCN